MTKALTINDVAKALQLSTSTVYKYAETGKIPSMKIGAARRFLETDVENYLTTCKTQSQSSNKEIQ
jgi:PTS system nitrogen regulatory IIA component